MVKIINRFCYCINYLYFGFQIFKRVKRMKRKTFLCGCSMRKTYMFYCNKHRKEIYLKIMKDSKYKNTRKNNEVIL